MRLPTSAAHAGIRNSPGHLLAVVISHADAPIVSWRSLVLDQDRVRNSLERMRSLSEVRGCAIVATCSRTDVYAEVRDRDAGRAQLLAALRSCTGASSAVLDRTRTLDGVDVARHLFRVAAGLESIALGEHEILGQLREALRLARESGVAGTLVHRLLERALATGARARQETSIGRGATTLGAAAAACLAPHGTSPAPQALALVIGAGAMARQAARHLKLRGFKRIAIVNRSSENAEMLARSLSAESHPLPALPSLLAEAHVGVAAVRAASPIVDVGMLRAARASSPSPLHLVDLGSPPNIDPACAQLPNIRRTDLDALHLQLSAVRDRRSAHIVAAEHIVGEELARFEAWRTHRRLVPAACLLRESFMAEARLVVAREGRRLSTSEGAEVQRIADAIVRRLLHRPLTHLQRLARGDVPSPFDTERPSQPTSESYDLDRLILDAYLTGALASDPPRS